MAKMRAVQVTKPKGPFELVEREIPQPGSGDARIKVQACGVCHAICTSRKDCGRDCNIRASPGTKSPVWWMRSATASRAGR